MRREYKTPPPYGYDDNDRPIWDKDLATGKPICGRRLPHGKVCHNPIRCKNGRCRVHQNKPVNVSTLIKRVGMRSSQVVPKSLQKHVNNLLKAPDSMSLKVDLALLDERQRQNLLSIEEGGLDADIYKQLTRIVSALKPVMDGLANETIDPISASIKLLAGWTKLYETINAGNDLKKMWAESTKISLQRAELVEAEARMIKLQQNYMPIMQVMELFMAFTGVIKMHIRDKTTLKAITNGLDELARDPKWRTALGAEQGATGYVDPNSKVSQSIMSETNVTADEDDFLVTDIYDIPNTFNDNNEHLTTPKNVASLLEENGPTSPPENRGALEKNEDIIEADVIEDENVEDLEDDEEDILSDKDLDEYIKEFGIEFTQKHLAINNSVSQEDLEKENKRNKRINQIINNNDYSDLNAKNNDTEVDL